MPRLLLGGSLFLAVLCLAPARAQAPQTPAVEKPSENQTERLAALGKLWGAVKFFHPFLAYRDIDWDGALVKAIPRVKITAWRSTKCSRCWAIPRQGSR